MMEYRDIPRPFRRVAFAYKTIIIKRIQPEVI
jgi:hypothetical protein